MSSQETSIRRYLDRSSIERNDTQVNTSNATSFANGIRHNETVTTRHNAKYKISVEYDCSMDATNSNIRVELVVDGVIVRIQEEEMQDSGGTAVNGSGTDQRLPKPLGWVGNLTAGDHTVILRFRADTNGVESTMHYSHITVERWI